MKKKRCGELIFVTNNRHKLFEIRQITGDGFTVNGLSDIGFSGEIPETEPDLEGNALMKARYIYERYGADCFADDTGLEVDALDGAPGVFSARYAGENATYADNVIKLLEAMNGKVKRTARFRTVIALILDGREYLFKGTVEGTILTENRGNKGFGYDPVFLPDGYDKSFAEMTHDEKNSISHRGRAVAALVQFLRKTGNKSGDDRLL
ncbi:MAG: non-canonical purine NTP diphosphatase [Bacteroidota bacterium]